MLKTSRLRTSHGSGRLYIFKRTFKRYKQNKYPNSEVSLEKLLQILDNGQISTSDGICMSNLNLEELLKKSNNTETVYCGQIGRKMFLEHIG